VGTFRALWATPYGQALLVKLFRVFPLLALGALNRYLSVPLLQRWAGRPVPRRRLLHILLAIRYLAVGRRRPWGIRLGRQWMRKVGAEASLIGGVFICTALLLHGVPARHFSNLEHRHRAEMPSSEPIGAIAGAHTKGPPHEGRREYTGAIAGLEPCLLLIPRQPCREDPECTADSRLSCVP
jgi:hypothetical protein